MLLAEEIMQTVTSVVDAAVDAYVFRGRVDPLSSLDYPAVGVFQGAETPAGELGQINTGLCDQLLEIRTEVAAAGLEANIETDLNELRRQVHLAMLADHTLGLAYVLDVRPLGADEPNINGSSERYTGTMVVNWEIHYRHQYADAGAAP